MKISGVYERIARLTTSIPVASISLIIVAFIITGCSYSQSSVSGDQFNFQLISYDEPDINAPGRGAEQWHNGTESINYGKENSVHPLNVYYRFTWNKLEDSLQDSYNWTFFDALIKEAIDKGQKLSFGIMTCYGDKADGVLNYDGGKSAYPLYLHKLMQSEARDSRDWINTDSIWIPNWNSPHYLGRLRALHEALYKHIITSSYTAIAGPHKGESIAFKNAIYCIDVRGYGNYGEWHNSGLVKHMSDYPKGRRATAATLKTIIDHHTQVFDLWPLTIMIAAFDAEQVTTIRTPTEVGYYALTTRNAWGPLGWRRDQWGATDQYLENMLKNNKARVSNGKNFGNLISNRYLAAPVTGEPPRYVNDGGSCPYWDLERQVMDYGASLIGDGNWGVVMEDCAKNNARNAFKRCGYRLILEGGEITPDLRSGSSFSIVLNWKNTGTAPTYEDWNVIYELKDSTGKLIWSGSSQFKPKLFNPDDDPTQATDQFVLPGNILPGNYELSLIIKDPTGYWSPLPLAIAGRRPDGSYLLKNISISGAQ